MAYGWIAIAVPVSGMHRFGLGDVHVLTFGRKGHWWNFDGLMGVTGSGSQRGLSARILMVITLCVNVLMPRYGGYGMSWLRIFDR